MAVHELWNVTVVLDIDGDLLPLFDAKQRTGRAAVVADRLNDLLRGNLDFDRSNAQRNARRIAGWSRKLFCHIIRTGFVSFQSMKNLRRRSGDRAIV